MKNNLRNTRTLILHLFAVSFLFTNVACSNDDDSASIDSDIQILVKEIMGTETNTFSLFCRTENIYPCVNYPILTTLDFKSNSLNINFTGVPEEIGICFTATGPATTEINLSALENGSYEIMLNNGSLNNSGTLTITDTKVELNVKTPKGIRITNPTLQRVPANTYWGLIGYSSKDKISKVNEFLSKLEQAGALFNKQTPGDYNHYEIDQNGEIKNDYGSNLSGYHFHNWFIFQYSGDEEALKETIKTLFSSNKDDLHIRLNTYKGEYIYNWTDFPTFSPWNQ
ncbi:hypothetical protein [Bacteroides sp. 51]|uniref:hypothetical protein n=1 Tax=Bacteroides sp. 51 TaxID=2302938 RepID=UPI0013D73951|nr:hypothetical protein [Bacteroides sp. 51]NDV80398.1 hypothetical protein [Bacteroides sp. 51]